MVSTSFNIFLSVPNFLVLTLLRDRLLHYVDICIGNYYFYKRESELIFTSWSCLHRWLQSHRRAQLCPVCKAGCSKEQVIPIYGRGKEAKDPRLNEDIPQRPQAQRPAPQPTNPFDPASFFFNNPFNNQNNNNVFQFHFFPGFIPSIFAFNFAQTQDNNTGRLY